MRRICVLRLLRVASVWAPHKADVSVAAANADLTNAYARSWNAERGENRSLEAVSEALLFASKAGADPALVRKALMGGFASSRILEVHGERMVKRNFDPGFRIELHQKDLNLALEGARTLGLSLPSTAVAQQLFSACTAHGGQAWDHSGMVRALELMAGHEIAAA